MKRLAMAAAAMWLLGAAAAPSGPRRLLTIETGALPFRPQLSPAGRVIALRTRSGGVEIRSLADGKLRGEIPGTPDPVAAFRLSADGSLLALRRGGNAEIWRLGGLAKQREFPAQATPDDEVALAPSGKLLATAGRLEVRVFDTATGKQIARWALPVGEVSVLLFTADERSLLIGGNNASLYRLDLADSTIRAENDELTMATFALALTDGGRRLLAAGASGALETLDAATLKRQRPATALGPAVALMAAPGSGRVFAAILDPNDVDVPPRVVAWSSAGIESVAPLAVGGALDERGRLVYVVPAEKGVEILRFPGE